MPPAKKEVFLYIYMYHHTIPKGGSQFAEYLAPFYWKPYLWSRSYFVCTVSERSHELITEYIRNQENKEKG